MGNFIHHNIGGVIIGSLCSVYSHLYCELPIIESISAGTLSYISSLLPDIDSPTSKPAEFVANITSVLSSSLFISYLAKQGIKSSYFPVFVIGGYIFTYIFIKQIIRRITHHRGVFHTIPASLIWGGCIYIVFKKETVVLQNILALSALFGYLTHLIIDELFAAIDITGGTFMSKRSFGTALKLGSNSIPVTLALYAILIGILWTCFR